MPVTGVLFSLHVTSRIRAPVQLTDQRKGQVQRVNELQQGAQSHRVKHKHTHTHTGGRQIDASNVAAQLANCSV